MAKFQPMLADDAVLDRIRFPVFASPKLDGVRATVVDGKLLTRSLKPLPNRHIQLMEFSHPFDGELIVGEPTSKSVFRDTMKTVMAHDMPIDDLRYFVFDTVGEGDFLTRMTAAACATGAYTSTVVYLAHTIVNSLENLLELESAVLEVGYEGLMIRDPHGPYKYGRATAREGYLLKVKRKKSAEARVIGFAEQMHNANEATVDNLGYTERSSHQANLKPMGTLGALTVRDLKTGVIFNVGTGFTAALRQLIWDNQERYIDTILTYEFLEVGVKDKPRHPTFKGFRHEKDMS